MFLKTEVVYILFVLILIVYYQKSKYFVISQKSTNAAVEFAFAFEFAFENLSMTFQH